MEKKILSPPEIPEYAADIACAKCGQKASRLIVLSILAGAFIALAAQASNMAAFNLLALPESYGLGRVLAGAVFSVGLMLVILAGGELFTGNTLMVTAAFERRIHVGQILRNWAFVYPGNLIGSLLIAGMIVHSGLLNNGDGMLGAVTLKIAVYKVSLDFMAALFLGILCNWLVCLAVWLSYAATTMAGKILAIFFPIWLFVTSGFEHSIANMYYIPAGLLIKNNPAFVEAAGLTQTALAKLSWESFFLNNLLPVTIGNIIGGSLMVGFAYWYAYRRASK
ncbi:MAG TPA: formate/nitrite transporter family protein [Clostridiales bacterium]|jgi:formate/nitrite transporter|nr:formate/nitrite transporter family protein [Clostridiales bacterium]